jgi:hypothetical protein
MNMESRQQIETYKGSTIHALQQAIRQYNKVVGDNLKSRETYLKSVIDESNERDCCSKQTIQGKLHREQTKSNFKIIWSFYKGSKGNGIQYIEFPDKHNKDK